MSYSIAAISNGGGAPEQAYRKMQSAGACPERPFAGTSTPDNASAIILGIDFRRGADEHGPPMAGFDALDMFVCAFVAFLLAPTKDGEILSGECKLRDGLDELQARSCTFLSYLFVHPTETPHNAAGSTDLLAWKLSR